MKDAQLYPLLQQLAPYFPECIRDAGFCLRIEEREYLPHEITEDPSTQDRIQGVLQRLCIAQGWFLRIKTRKDGTAHARVSPRLNGIGPKHLQEHGQTFAGALAATILNTARYTHMDTRRAEVDDFAWATWGGSDV